MKCFLKNFSSEENYFLGEDQGCDEGPLRPLSDQVDNLEVPPKSHSWPSGQQARRPRATGRPCSSGSGESEAGDEGDVHGEEREAQEGETRDARPSPGGEAGDRGTVDEGLPGLGQSDQQGGRGGGG